MISIKKITFLNEIGDRPQLEDCIYPLPGTAAASDKLFLVCDGVGGENLGEEASRIACKEFAFYFEHFFPKGTSVNQAYIKEAQKHVLQQMRNYADEHPKAEKMSTTLTLVYLGVNELFIAWCGDSRIYYLRNGAVLWRSTDHSLVASLVKHGEISEEEAKQHPQRNIITRSLSASGNPSEIATYQIRDLQDNDQIMMCTDGMLEQITEERLKEILLSPGEDKKSLFMAYCEGNTRDNFSLYLLELGIDRQFVVRKNSKLLISILIIIIAAVLAGFLRRPIRNLLLPPAKQKKVSIQRFTNDPVHCSPSKGVHFSKN